MIEGIYEIRRERSLEYLRLAQSKYHSAVRPIYGISRRGVAPKHIGSCVLLAIDDAKFLLTAGHVTDNAKSTMLHVASDSELIPLSFDANPGVTTNPALRRSEDLYDFSICALSDAMQCELGEVKYITEDEILASLPTNPNRLRMAMGYPTSKNKKGIDNPRKYVGGITWTYISLSATDHDDEDHAFIEFDHKKSVNPDGIGTHSLMPTGASGGGMFDLGKLDDPIRLAKPAQCEAKLIGILTEYRSGDKLIVATSMKPILEACRSWLVEHR